MGQFVQISFQCLPLRAVGRFDPPPDMAEELQGLHRRIRWAAEKHGFFNSYYLYDGQCIFHFTNDEQLGTVEFGFEGTVLTDTSDCKTQHCDLAVQLRGEVCPWLTAAAAQWLAETVPLAVKVEFDRYIASGDLQKAVQRLERLQAESDARGGYLGMGL